EFERATRVTYLGTVWGTRAALTRMLPRNRGSIVLVGSALAYRGIPLQAPYCGAKHAIQGFQESLRCELRNRGSEVHLSIVHLPGLNTPQFDHCLSKMPRHPQPVPPIFQPEAAAPAVHWAAHHRRRGRCSCASNRLRSIRSASREARAMIVSAGLAEPCVGITLPSAMNRFGTSHVR